MRGMSRQTKNTEYLFGASVVIAAMQHDFRKPSCLFVKQDDRFGGLKIKWDGEAVLPGQRTPGASIGGMEGESRDVMDLAVQLANRREIRVKEAPASQLDKLSGGRPHQGLVLATLPPRVVNLTGLGNCDFETADGGDDADADGFGTDGAASRAGRTERGVYQANSVDGPLLMRAKGSRRYPLWLALDQIVDPQNLGAILRSAFFFGVDGVVVTERDSAPFSPVASKASAGAMEAMQLFSTPNLTKFLTESALNGWQLLGTDIYASKAVTVPLHMFRSLAAAGAAGPDAAGSRDPRRPLRPADAPTLLVLGNEGRGMRRSVSRQCHHHLVISQGPESVPEVSNGITPTRVDSLNVSVAAGILLHELTQGLEP
ncbi:hypothetical protein HK105_207494 [Polyrhizophydium stewartii]|uniref:rRNA methyltransferase 1, mitochondrial n=1 Tax=Polyrhizophydium stewartii TaxID=2732419 RepID=A0ABR4N0N2_9FUNG